MHLMRHLGSAFLCYKNTKSDPYVPKSMHRSELKLFYGQTGERTFQYLIVRIGAVVDVHEEKCV